MNFYDYKYITERRKLDEWTKEEVQKAGDTIGVNLGKYNYKEVMLGMKIESRHGSKYGNEVNVTGDQAEPTLKLVIANLRMDPNYYTKFSEIEMQGERQAIQESIEALTDFGMYVNNVRKQEESEKLAAGMLPICKSTGRILLVKRSDKVSNPGTWAGIGGGIEEKYGETEENVIDIVKREFFEETGCKEFYNLIPSYIYITSNGGFKYYNFIGIFENEFEPELNQENTEYRWFSLDEVQSLSNDDIHFGIRLLFLNDPDIIKKYAR